MTDQAQEFRAIAQRAMELVPDGAVLGLGSGHTTRAFLHVLAERVRAGLSVRGIPTSEASAELARALGIPLTNFDETPTLDVDFDGADEVDPQGNLIKGYGGALVREKIVATASRRLVILVTKEKLVPVLGTRGKLPVEVISFGWSVCQRQLRALGCEAELRVVDGSPVVTDNGNYILDCRVGPLDRPAEFDQAIRALPAVVGSGLFLGMRPTVVVGLGNRVEVRSGDAGT